MTNMRGFDGPGARPKDGQVFIISIGEHVLPGRVIRTDAKSGPSMSGILTYVFQPVRPEWSPDNGREDIRVDRLLIPPFLINQKPWSLRFFHRVAQLDSFGEDERLTLHCFRAANGTLTNELGEEVTQAVEPLGPWALDSYRTVDDALSDALGIPRVPD